MWKCCELANEVPSDPIFTQLLSCLSAKAEIEAMLRCDDWESEARGIGEGRGGIAGWGEVGVGVVLEEEAHRC